MDAIENAAYVSVGRACGFAGLAIFCLLAGLSFDPVLATETGGKACLVVTAVLVFKGVRAPFLPYARTELWLILPKDQQPPKSVAQKVVGTTLRRTYVWFAQQAAVIAAILLISAIVLQLAGVPRFEYSPRQTASIERCLPAEAQCRSQVRAAVILGAFSSPGNP